MANLVQELLIRIGLKADTAQGQQVADTVKEIGSGAKQAGAGLADSARSSKDLAQELGKTAAVGSATKEFLGAVRDIGKGGADSLFAMGRAAISFVNVCKTQLLTSGPVGWAIIALGSLATAAIVLKDAFTPATESVGDLKKRLEELDKANLRALDATLSALSDRLKNAKDEADAVRASLDKIDDAEMAAQLATVKKSDLTPNQKEEQELIIRDEFKRRREGRQRDALTEAASGARETRDALAPEFEDARQKYGDLLNEKDAIVSRDREIARLRRDAGLLAKQGYINDAKELNAKADALKAAQPSGDDLAKLDVELASARDRFQGADGKGGIAAQYQVAARDAEKADRALARFNYELVKIGEWDRARVRIERGVDPRDTEAAARQSPGRNRLVGADGRVIEYDSAAAPTINQQIVASTDAMRRDGVYLPGERMPGPVVAPQNQVTFGGLKPGSDTKDGAVARALKDTATATEEADTGAGTAEQAEQLKEATEKHAAAVKESAQKTDAAMADASRALAAASGVLATHNGRLGNHDAEFRRVWGAISALQSSRSA